MQSTHDIDAQQIMAAGEDVTRTIIGNVLDAISTSAIERSAKWHDTDDAIRHLQRIRTSIDNGEELTWAVIDFWTSLLPDSNLRVIRVPVTEEEYAGLAEQGRALGMTPEGYLTALTQKNVKDFNRSVDQRLESTDEILRPGLIIANSPQQAEQFIINNAEVFAGWRLTTHILGQPVNRLRGLQFELAAVITPLPADSPIRSEALVTLRHGDAPTMIDADPNGKVNLVAAFDEQRLRNQGLA